MNTARSYVLLGLAFLVALGCSSTVLDDQPVDPSDLASLTAIRVDPPVVTLEATASQPATQTYRSGLQYFPHDRHSSIPRESR